MTHGEGIQWSIVAIAVSVTATGVLPAFLTAALSVQIQEDLDLSVAVLGALFGLFFGVSALASALLGRVVQRRGWAQGIRLSAIGSGLSLIGMATLARNAWTITAMFVAGGLAAALSQPAANLALASSVPRDRQGLIFGLKHTAVPSAAMLGGLAVPGFGLTVGWRWAFVAAAGVAFATALSVPRRSPEVLALSGPGSGAMPATALHILVMLAVATALGIGAIDALAAFIVAYAVEIGVGEGSAGFLLAAGSLVALLTRLIAGWLVDRYQPAGLLGVAGLLSVGTLGLAALAAGGRQWLVVGAMLGFAGGWGWSGLMTFVVVWANPNAAATATGITHTGTYVGAAAGPPLVGLIATRVSFEAAWWVTVGALGLAAILVSALWLFARDTVKYVTPTSRTSDGQNGRTTDRA